MWTPWISPAISCRLILGIASYANAGDRDALADGKAMRGGDAGPLWNYFRDLEHDLVVEDDAEGRGRLQIQHELEGHRLLDGQIGRLRGLQ
jgi:hypothetical protein